jgi:hypothetical protein
MFEKIFSLLNDSVDVDHASLLMDSLGDLIDLIDKEYRKPNVSLDDIIDTICEIIKKHEQ